MELKYIYLYFMKTLKQLFIVINCFVLNISWCRQRVCEIFVFQVWENASRNICYIPVVFWLFPFQLMIFVSPTS